MKAADVYAKIGFSLYTHQVEAFDAIRKGRNIILSTGTGSGKTESVLLPALENNLRLILVYPTKA